jgi:hypothetical protein
MKKFSVVLLVLIASFVKAQTIIMIEEMNKITGNTVSPKLTGYVQHIPKGKQVGGFGFAQVQQKWAQCILGVVYAPRVKKLDVLEISLGAGIEQANVPWRVQANIFLKKSNFSLLGAVEYGGGGHFYLVAPTYRVKGWLLGARAQRYYGVGPTIGYTIGPMTIWGSPMYEIEEKRFTGTVALVARF